MGEKSIQEAQRVLLAEGEALKTLASKLDKTFSDVIEKLKNIKGRVIVSGMGKSGHVDARLRPRWHRPEHPPISCTPAKPATAIWA